MISRSDYCDRLVTALVGVTLALASAVAAADGETLTLGQAIRRALEVAPPQQIAEQSIAAAAAQREVAAAALRPQLGVGVSQIRQTSNLATFGFPLPGIPPVAGPYSVFDARLKLSQHILDLSAWATLAGADQAVQVAQAQARQNREQIASNVALAYIDVLAREEAQAAADADLALAQDLLVLAQDQRTAGVASGIDVARSETVVAQDRYSVAQAQTQLAEARLRLQRLAVLPMDAAPRLAGSLSATAAAPDSAATALAVAHEHRPEIAVIQALQRQADAELRAVERKRLPTLSLVADYGISANTPNENDEDTYRYGAVLDLPIYSGGAIAAQVSQARVQIEQRRLELDDVHQQIEQDVRLALATSISAQQQLHAAEASRDLALRELDLARDRFANGVANNVEVISAQTRLTQARAQYVAALAACQQARVNLAAAEGRAESFDL